MSFDIRVGQTGNFQLLTPFDTTLKTELQYTCIAIRKIKDYILDGIDVYTEIYKKCSKDSFIYRIFGCILSVFYFYKEIQFLESGLLFCIPLGFGLL